MIAHVAEIIYSTRNQADTAHGEKGGKMIDALSHFITFCAGGAVGILAFCYLYYKRDR